MIRIRSLATMALAGSLAVAPVLSGCYEAMRSVGTDQGNQDRDERLKTLEEESLAVQARLKALTDEEEKRAARLTELLERATSRLDSLTKDSADRSRQLDALRDEIRAMRPTVATPRNESAPECRLLGRRAIIVLLRDDMIAAEGFIRLYTTFGCPMERLGLAFGCAIPAAPPTSGVNVDAVVDSCWRELKPPK
jgi:hypothetical protein